MKTLERRMKKALALLLKIREVCDYSRDFGQVECNMVEDTYGDTTNMVKITFWSWGYSGSTWLKLLSIIKKYKKLDDMKIEATDIKTEGRQLKFTIYF